jgi:hypothetical protein
MVFDVKYDLRNTARPIRGGSWTEDIYFGVFRMDTVRIGDFLGELYGLSCCVCGVRNVFICRKKQE